MTGQHTAGEGAKQERIRGVFSTQEVKRVGTGTTTRKTIQKAFWYVDQNDAGGIEVQPLNNNYIPSGPKRAITMEELIEKFAPEPEFYVQTVYPKMRELNQTVARGDRHRQRGEHFSAEFEYGNALKVDEDNVRANFGLGLTYLSRGDTDKADDIFGRLVKLDAAFEEEHKHLFNDFGINLRKSKMLEQAVTYYSRALELSSSDENLHLNIARALLEKQDYPTCAEHVLQALSLNPTHDAGLKFLVWLQQKNLMPEALLPRVAEALRRAKESAAQQAPA